MNSSIPPVDSTIRDANGDLVPYAPEGSADYFATRVPAPNCPHYMATSELSAGYTTCERCE